MSQTTTIDVTIYYDETAQEFRADIKKATGKRNGFVSWDVKRKDSFPNNATVILQFVDRDTPPKTKVDGPMADANQSHGRYQTTGRFISCTVSNSADGSFYYTLSYDDGGTEKLLVDPELVIDGNSPGLIKFLKSVKQQFKALRQRQRLQEQRDRAGRKATLPAKRKAKKR